MANKSSARSCEGFGGGGLSMCSRSGFAVQQFARFLMDSSSHMFMECKLNHNTAASGHVCSVEKN